MKKILRKYRVMSNRDDFAITGRHISFLRMQAFATETINFTEEEDAHFDICRVCRLDVIDAIRNLAPLVVCTTMRKAA